MKKLLFLTFYLCAGFSLSAQPTFSVSLGTDSLLMGNKLKVSFSLKGGQGSNFTPPSFENFIIVGGPNHSTSMQIMNGEITQSTEITYYVEPLSTGVFYIEPASIEVDEQVLNTLPIEVIVHPNPAGIKQPADKGQDDFFKQFDSFNPWEKVFPGLESNPKNNPQPAGKKRKIYKI